MIILFINHAVESCGVYQYGKNLVNILKKSTKNTYEYFEVSSHQEYCKYISCVDYDAILYNYHYSTLNWLNPNTIQKYKPNICIPHENNPFSFMFDLILSTNPLSENGILRPLFEVDYGSCKFSNESFEIFANEGQYLNIPIIGSFGFGIDRKGFHHIVELVNQQFDKAIIKFIIPNSYYADPHGNVKNKIRNYCEKIIKPGISFLFWDKFVPKDELLKFLSLNMINIFAYEQSNDVYDGISSVVDYALSVNVPIGITNVSMFRHIYHKNIDIDQTSIKDILSQYENPYKELWSNQNLIDKIEVTLSNYLQTKNS